MTANIQIGKHGITDGIITEIQAQLQNTDPLTIRLLKNFRDTNDRKAAAHELAERTGSRVHRLVGGTLLLTRKH